VISVALRPGEILESGHVVDRCLVSASRHFESDRAFVRFGPIGVRHEEGVVDRRGGGWILRVWVLVEVELLRPWRVRDVILDLRLGRVL